MAALPSAASMLGMHVPLAGAPVDLTPLLKSSLKNKAPSLFDELATPCDVLPVSSSLRRVVGAALGASERPPGEKRRLAWLLFIFVVLDSCKGLLVAWSTAHDCRALAPVALCAKTALSIGFGLLMAALLEGRPGLRRCLNVGRSLRLLPVAACFCTAQMAMLEALRAFNAGSLKIMAQVNLPTTAVLCRLVLGRRYTTQQWAAIALLAAAVTAFMQVRMLYFRPPYWLREEVTPGGRIFGVFSLLCSILLSCSASILAERFLKERVAERAPFYIQKTNIMLGELGTASVLAALYLQHWVWQVGEGEEDFCSWEQVADWRQLLVVVVWAVHGWMAGILVKQCSTVAKNISHILSATVMYFLPLAFVHGAVNFGPVTVCALLVLLAILVFALAPEVREQRARLHHGVHFEEPWVSAWERPPRETSLAAPLIPKAPSSTNLEQHPAGSEGSCYEFVHEPYQHMGLLVVSFILLDAGKPLLVNWTHNNKAREERHNNLTFILVQTSLSLLIGLLVAAKPNVSLAPLQVRLHPAWRLRVWRCLDPSSVWRQMPVSFCLAMSKLCLIMALERLDAGSVRVLCQSSLPVVGVFGAVFFSRRYSAQQWCSLAAVTVALGSFYYVKRQVKIDTCASQQVQGPDSLRHGFCASASSVGSILALSSIGFNCLGALLVEKFLQRRTGRLYEQKAQLVLGEVVVNALLLVSLPFFISDPDVHAFHSPWKRGFFAGWDLRVFICVLVWIPSGWTATMLVKEASNLVKVVAQGAASVLTYVFSLSPLVATRRDSGAEPVSPPAVVLALCVLFAALTFGLDSAHLSRPRVSSKVAEKASPQKECASTAPVVPRRASGG